MAIVIILAEKESSLYWVTMLIKVIMCELPGCSLRFHVTLVKQAVRIQEIKYVD